MHLFEFHPSSNRSRWGWNNHPTLLVCLIRGALGRSSGKSNVSRFDFLFNVRYPSEACHFMDWSGNTKGTKRLGFLVEHVYVQKNLNVRWRPKFGDGDRSDVNVLCISEILVTVTEYTGMLKRWSKCRWQWPNRPKCTVGDRNFGGSELIHRNDKFEDRNFGDCPKLPKCSVDELKFAHRRHRGDRNVTIVHDRDFRDIDQLKWLKTLGGNDGNVVRWL